MPWVMTDSPIVAIPKIQKIPKADKTAMTLDMASDKYKWALNNPMDFMRNQMKTDLLYLLNQGLGFKDIDPGGRVAYQNRLAEFYKKPGFRKAIFITREHFKSTFAKGYIVQVLLNDPNYTFLVRSHTAKKAWTFVDVIQKRIKNPNLFVLFGDLSGDKWSQDSLNISLRTEHVDEYSVYATGLGTDVTGYHPQGLILDDPVSDDNYNTEEGRRTVKEDYDLLMFVVKQFILINGTRWGEYELYGDLMERNKKLAPNDPEKYDVLLMSVYGEANDKMETPEDGTPIFLYTYRNGKPEKIKGVTKGEEWIASKRMLGAYKFSCQVLNNPIPSADQVFHEADFNLWEYSKEISDLLKTCDFYLTIDPAGTNRKYSDETAFIVCGVTPDYHIYIVEAKAEKIDLTESSKTIEYIFKYVKKWKIKKIGIEQGIYDSLYKKPIKDRRWLEKLDFTIKSLKYGGQPGITSNKKIARIAGMEPYFDMGVFHINKKLFKLQTQLLKWRPYKTSHDDLADALAYQLQLIPRHIQKEIERTVVKNYFFRSLDRKRQWKKKGDNDVIRFINEEVFNG